MHCANCQSVVPDGVASCPVCRSTVLPVRRIITGGPAATATPAAPVRRPRLAAAPAPATSSSAPAGATSAPSSGTPGTTVTAGPTLGAAAPTPVTSTRAGGLNVTLTGHVSGSVEFGQRQVGSGAAQLLIVVCSLTAFVIGVILLARVLLVFLLPLIALIVVISVVVDRGAGFGTLKSLFGAGAGVGGLGRAMPGRPGLSGPMALDVTRFRITDASGVPYDCEILGELRAPPPKLNDDVELTGRRRRDGVIQVRRLRNRVSGTTLQGRVPLSTLGAQAAPWILGFAVVVLVIFLINHGS